MTAHDESGYTEPMECRWCLTVAPMRYIGRDASGPPRYTCDVCGQPNQVTIPASARHDVSQS